MQTTESLAIRQHLIDPEVCIRCNTCEASCPVGAITHDSRNYVVDVAKCNLCMACIPPCPTGSIDNWRSVPRALAYSVEAQLGWDALPAELSAQQLAELGVAASDAPAVDPAPSPVAFAESPGASPEFSATQYGSSLPPWSAAHPYTNLYGPKAAEKSITATVAGNVRVTKVGHDYDTHHIVLDFGAMPFPVLEGQSIGIIAPGTDADGRPHHARQYSIASPRNGERPGYNNLALTVKRVLEDHQGNPVRGVCSNHVCDLKRGDPVQVVGPFGSSFLIPNHPRSHIVMICTGTGSAPMRAMTEWRRRLRRGGAGPSQADTAPLGGSDPRSGGAWGPGSGNFEGGKLMLFFGARSKEELPYFGPLQSLPKDFIDINFAFSRTPGQPKRYVQDLMRSRAADLAPLLTDPNAYFYVCGLKSMEEGVLLALRDVAQQAGLSWDGVAAALKKQARLHLETY
ncbi:MAG: benzoyl-CoA 2,3-epoxidase subunit BoxA [Rhodoferax sp.]